MWTFFQSLIHMNNVHSHQNVMIYQLKAWFVCVFCYFVNSNTLDFHWLLLKGTEQFTIMPWGQFIVYCIQFLIFYHKKKTINDQKKGLFPPHFFKILNFKWGRSTNWFWSWRRMNQPIDEDGTVHFTTTLFALIREVFTELKVFEHCACWVCKFWEIYVYLVIPFLSTALC